MHSHGALKIVPAHMLKRTYFDDARVVDQDVDFAKAIDNLPNSRLNLSRIEQIAFNGQDYAAARSEIDLCTREFIRVARDERNVAALRTNLPRKHESKSARAARNKRDLILQGVARRSSDAQNQPYGKEESACQPQNARIHFRKL